MKAMSILAPTGIPYDELFLGLHVKQHPGYYFGFMGSLVDYDPDREDYEWRLRRLLDDATEGINLEEPIPGVKVQYFHQTRLFTNNGAFNYKDMPFQDTYDNYLREPYARHLDELGTQGRFELRLLCPQANDGKWKLEINVKWKLEYATSVGQYRGTLQDLVNQANRTITDVWGGFSLVSGNLAIPICPQIISVEADEDKFFTVTVFPDTATDADMQIGQTQREQVNINDYHWLMRETLTFSKIDVDRNRAGRGPHEFGHMIGLPHDLYQENSVMFGIPIWESDRRLENLPNFRYGGSGKIFASHFKIVKLWADELLSKDFIIKPPPQ